MKIVLASALLSLAAGTITLAQSPGEFTPTGSMNVPRVWHTATLLMNGKVLIAGGRYSGSGISRYFALPEGTVTASAELYDPATETFARTGDMTMPRSNHTATLLPDGTVLIVGGIGSGPGLTWELYDPGTGTFRTIGNSVTGADVMSCTAATLLNNGKVLIAIGTLWPGPTALGVPAIVYDPIEAQFAPTAFSVTTHSDEYTCPSATMLADGRVLVAWEEPDTEVYRPESGSFARAGDMVVRNGYQDYTATLLTTGTVLIAGTTGYGVVDSAELYDPAAGGFTSTGNLNEPRGAHTSTLLPDGTVLVTGGWGPQKNAAFDDAEVYDPGSGTFSLTGKTVAARFGHTATLLPDGTVLLAGGAYGLSDPYVVASAELYRPVVLTPPPELLSLSGDDQGAILHAGTARIVSADDPAVPGEVLEIYATGLADGSVIPPQVAIGGRMAEILSFGKAPGFTDRNQVNVRVPDAVDPGDAVPVRLIYLGRPSNEVTIGVR